MITFRRFCEKIFDNQFIRKSEQDESLEVLQQIGKMVDSRKVRENKIALRNGIYILFKRPMTATGTGYLIAQVVDDSGAESTQSKPVDAKIVKTYGGNDFKVGDNVEIDPIDAMAVSQDNKRFYIVYPPFHPSPSPGDDAEVADKVDDVEDDVRDLQKSLKGLGKSVEKDSKDEKADKFLSKIKSMESISEKYLSDDEIQDLIDSIIDKLEGRKDKDAKGMLKLTRNIEKTFIAKGKLHPNSVIAIQRIATGVAGGWGKNSPDWDGGSPSGRLNKYPPPPTQYIAKARRA